MSTLPSSPFFTNTNIFLSSQNQHHNPLFFHTHFLRPFSFPFPQPLSLPSRTPPSSPLLCKSSSEGAQPQEAENDDDDDEWLQKLPEKSKPLYSHSLPCIEAWLRSLGFWQSKEDRALWVVHKPDWHAHLSLDVTDLYVRYLKSGPGNLEKDVERRFSYALSREDIENAVLGGP